MANQKHYGNTVFLKDFQKNSSAKTLERLHFTKNGTESAPYDEDWIQQLIMNQPSLLPVDQIEPAFADMVPVCIELPVKSGFMDNLFVTPAGDLAFVECKLWRNPEARREVIAQIIDYASEVSTWTYDMLQKAIDRTKSLDPSGEGKRPSLYELVAAAGEVDEAFFHDAVSRNLRRGRFLLLVVGDGIQEGVETMATFLQQHAGFHFTLALVELALFRVPTGGYIAQPRILARTTNIDRGIVRLDEDRIAIKPSTVGPAAVDISGRRTTITQELYFEQLERIAPGISTKINAFIDRIGEYNVSPEFGTASMILRWHSNDSKSWNLGTIPTTGLLWMDYLGQETRNAGLLDLHKRYLSRLEALVPGASVKKTPKEAAWYLLVRLPPAEPGASLCEPLKAA